jgi:hypothetical protein
MSDDSEKKKDLTGILELSALMPPQSQEELLKQDPYAVNEVQPIEQIDDFASIESIGMMDHEPEPLDPLPTTDAPVSDSFTVEDPFATNAGGFSGDPFAITPDEEPATSEAPASPETTFNIDLGATASEYPTHDSQSGNDASATLPEGDPFNFSTNDDAKPTPTASGPTGFSFSGDPDSIDSTPAARPFPTDTNSNSSTPSAGGISGIKQYSERSREATFSANAKSPFHLWMHGQFDPFSRDKLLHFISDNPMGLNSSDLDRQINAGRVLFPRISEFAGIKLIQDLRDSGLAFKLSPSSREADEIMPEAEGLRLAYEANPSVTSDTAITVLPGDAIDIKLWQAFDSIQLVQFLKAEILEVERSELFQELLERMTTSLKQKAKLRGASAISALKHELKPLRLPSHYQIELKATLLKKL